MKILIASDLHGSMFWAKKLLNKFENGNFDKLILLGDLYYHGPRNPLPKEYNPKMLAEELNKLADKILVIKGNCDAEVDEMISKFPFYEKINLEINGKNVFFSHGHHFDIDNFPNDKFDIMFYGHYHVNFIKEKDGKIFVNPGSISLPKNDTKNSYAVFDESKISILDFDDNVIYERKI